MPAKERVYEGDRAYFPDFGVWLDPGDDVPDGAPEDPRFVAKGAKSAPKKRTARKPRAKKTIAAPPETPPETTEEPESTPDEDKPEAEES